MKPKALTPVLGLVFGYWLLSASSVCAADEKSKDEKTSVAKPDKSVRTLGVFIFPGFQMLDACGPMEIWGNLKSQVKVVTVAAQKGEIASVQGPKMIAEFGFEDCPPLDLILLPGGIGVLKTIKDKESLDWLREKSSKAELTMSVCNGATILAACGLLDGRPATTNKAYWSLATAPGPNVKWVRHARWVDDGNIVTSSGVSAGMDMSLHVVERLFGPAKAEQLANEIEYEWHRDAAWDPFADKSPQLPKKKQKRDSQ